ncbi:hypothetical protein YC2023_109947 [Brassica napus]
MDDARRVLLGMSAPDVVSYNTLMHGLGKIREAFLLFVRNIPPSVVTYNTLMDDGLCESGDLESAQRLKAEMFRKRIDPDVKTYTTLVKGFVKSGNLSMATATYDEMLEKGIEPDAYTRWALFKHLDKDHASREVEFLEKILRS